MSQVMPQAAPLPLRIVSPCEKDTCSGEVVAVETKYTTEIFVRCAPLRGEAAELDFEGQTRRFYNCLPKLLGRAGGEVKHVILERAFFEDFARDMDTFLRVRQESYEFGDVPADQLPATTYIRQPPCHEPQKVELQIYAVVPKSPEAATVETHFDPETRTTAKLLTIGGRRHLYIADIKGVDPRSTVAVPFREQSDRMFANAARLLEPYQTKFTEVLRTWCYLKEIDDDYAEFNLSRNVFFAQHGVKRLPASTGIRAGLWPDQALCGMDLYVLLDIDGVGIEVMHTPTLNEADEYGSSFSRGMKIDLPEKTVLHISGTASINEVGETVHVGDPQKQLERMLVNVRELLNHQGASFEDVTQIATFLKHADYYDACQQLLRDWGVRHVPNTFVEAGVCRPELLCEMEAIAILPK
jgi:enamine deaminase RidA (YjgF/YER057c/UK114 family)